MSSSSRPESDGTGASGEPTPSPSGGESERSGRPTAGTAVSGARAALRSLLARRSSLTAAQPLDPDSTAIWEHDSPGPVTPAASADRAGGARQPGGLTGADGRPKAVGRPTRTIVLAAVCGAALLTVPFLVVGTGGHGGKQHSSAKATLDVVEKSNSGMPDSTSLWPTASSSGSAPSTSGTPGTTSSHGSSAPGATADSGHAPSHASAPAPPPHKSVPSKEPGIAQTFGGANHVLLRNLGTRLCADLPDYGAGKSGGKVEQFTCKAGSSDNQMWTLRVSGSAKGPGGAEVFTISNDKDGLCMDIPNFTGEPSGTAVSEYACNSTTSDNQLWYLAPADAHHYRLRNLASSGRCLTVSGGASAAYDAKLIINTCESSADDWAMATS